MRILAVDTSSKTVSVALLERDVIVLELNSGLVRAGQSVDRLTSRAGSDDIMAQGYVKQKSRRGSGGSRVFTPGASTLLAPMIKTVLDQTGQSIRQIDLVALTKGPGLFTGLRVGVVTAKSLAYATNADLIGVNTLEVVAAQTAADRESVFPDGIKSIRVVLNAQRQQLFCGHYQTDSNWKVTELEPNQILDRETWLGQLTADEVVSGSGLRPIVDDVRKSAPHVTIAPEEIWACNAGSVGKLAWHQFQTGKRDDLWKLQPLYFRPSAAEEKRDAKESD